MSSRRAASERHELRGGGGWRKQDGEKALIEKQLTVRPWWRTDEEGQVSFLVRIG